MSAPLHRASGAQVIRQLGEAGQNPSASLVCLTATHYRYVHHIAYFPAQIMIARRTGFIPDSDSDSEPGFDRVTPHNTSLPQLLLHIFSPRTYHRSSVLLIGIL